LASVTSEAETRTVGVRWDRLTVTMVLSFFVLVAGLSVSLVLGELRDELGLSGLVAAAHGSSFGVGLLVMGALGVRLVGRIGRTVAFWSTCGVIVVGVAVLCLGRHWWVTLCGTAIAGVACALLVLLAPGIVADHHGDGWVHTFAAVNGVPGFAGIALSLVVGAAIAAGISWRAPYLAVTLLFALALVLVGRRARLPRGTPTGASALSLLRRAGTRRPFIDVVHAVISEFPLGVWAVVVLKEVGGASGGAAAALGAVWGLSIMVSRLALPRIAAVAGRWTGTLGYAAVTVGSALVWLGPGLGPRVFGIVVAGFGTGPLYPLAVERLYARVDADTVSLGAVTALASGVAITTGPLLLGTLADVVGLRHAVLLVTALGIAGVLRSRPNTEPPQLRVSGDVGSTG
jgi:predicted MFS family arabinose efflux permease